MQDLSQDILVRPERHSDQNHVYRLNSDAFPSRAEADLVEMLRSRHKFKHSLVAVCQDRILGHIGFTEVQIEKNDARHTIYGLGPMAVRPEDQRRGVGQILVRLGLGHCRRDGAAAVVVLGHKDYYPRFGFQIAKPFGITSEYDIPDEYFMVLSLEPGALEQISGIVRYQPEFNAV